MESTTYFCKKRRTMKKVIFGSLVLSTGILLLGFNLNMLDAYYRPIVFSWQMLLIAIGLINLGDKHSAKLGTILIAVGTFFILPKLFDLGLNFAELYWPALLIFAGVLIIVSRTKHEAFHKPHNREVNLDSGVINENNVFGGSKVIVTAPEFKGGEVNNVFGGCKIDLSHTHLAPGTNILNIRCVFGGVSLIVPPHWVVKSEVTAIMGGFEDKRMVIKTEDNADHVLLIKGECVFGGGEIK